MNDQKPDPKTQSAPTGKPETAASGAKSGADDRRSVNWVKQILAVAGAIVTIGGAVAVISQFTHWLDFISHASASTCPSSTSLEVSPGLGISFYQSGQIDPMSLSATNAGDQSLVFVNVCMKSEPFELWFPTLSAGSSLEVCTSDSRTLFSSIFNPKAIVNCLTPGTGGADYSYASAFLIETTPQPGLPASPAGNYAHTEIYGTRAQPASGGDEKYYVSNVITPSGRTILLANQDSNLYLAIYLSNKANDQGNKSNNTEFFVLSFR